MADRKGLFRRRNGGDRAAAKETPAAVPARKRRAARRGRFKVTDAILTGIGLGLGAASFTFPWYVFLHQEDFGVRVVDFGDSDIQSDLSGPFYTHRVKWTPKPLTDAEIAAIDLDFLPTGTVRPDAAPATQGKSPRTPFPEPAAPNFSLVHVANGRAMIQDANGFWVVERGSVLPDNSRVAAIEESDDGWVLRTSNNQVVRLGP